VKWQDVLKRTDVDFITLTRNYHELEKMDLEEWVQITDSLLI
jgi:F-box/leucine-rich repeat protein 2/20